MKIDSKDITVVIQGSTRAQFQGRSCVEATVESIKKVLPKASIIISTWAGEVVFDLGVQKVIYNIDPGAKTRDCTPNSRPNNVNRQIVSTINGLREVKTKYAMKLRSDFLLLGDEFLKYYKKVSKLKTDSDYQIFSSRVLCAMFGTRKPMAKHYNLPFHVADFWTFGLTEDLIKLYDIALVTDEEFEWFMVDRGIKPDTWAKNRYNAEQSIWINCLKKQGVEVKCEYSTHLSAEIVEQSDRFLANNFYPIAFKKIELLPQKKNLRSKEALSAYSDYYTQAEWMELYKKYCDKHVCTPFDFERKTLDILVPLYESKIKVVRKLSRGIAGLIF